MASTCPTCEHRIEAVTAWPAPPSQLDVCVVTLRLIQPITPSHAETHLALNTLLNNIVDHEDSTPHPSTFTVWSPSRSDPSTAVIITTVRGVCDHSSSPIFEGIRRVSREPPKVRHMYIDMAVTSLAASSPAARIACDIIQLRTWRPEVAAAMGKMFGWEPQHSSISRQLEKNTSAAFSRPGDLIRDFWAWAEVPYTSPESPSSSASSSVPSIASRSSQTLAEQQLNTAMDEETLVMMFQWSNRTDADRFKDIYKKSYGPNGEEVQMGLWKWKVLNPISQLERLEVQAEILELELRAVEPRLCINEESSNTESAVRERRRSKRLSVIVSELGDKVSGWWNKAQ